MAKVLVGDYEPLLTDHPPPRTTCGGRQPETLGDSRSLRSSSSIPLDKQRLRGGSRPRRPREIAKPVTDFSVRPAGRFRGAARATYLFWNEVRSAVEFLGVHSGAGTRATAQRSRQRGVSSGPSVPARTLGWLAREPDGEHGAILNSSLNPIGPGGKTSRVDPRC
ncbi:hypothetical protein VUR80DRAFT_9121 [Thermomyces stellatus]